MKYIFVNPVSFIVNYAPIIGVPELIGVLENENQNAEFLDLNLKYFNCFESAKSVIALIQSFDNFVSNINEDENLPILKNIFSNIKKQYKIERNNLFYIASRIVFCRKVLKSKKYFYNLPLCEYSHNIISKFSSVLALEWRNLLSELVPDIETMRSYSKERKIALDLEALIDFFTANKNSLTSFYEKEIVNLLEKNPDCIGVSVNSESQFLPALYFCFLLKQKTSVHINIGGSFVNELYGFISNFDKLFETFFDSVSIGSSYLTVVQLLKYIDKKIKISEVNNLLYKSNGKIVVNNSNEQISINSLPVQSFSGYDFSAYLSPELVVPIRASFSCYWKKCIFCSCSNDGEKYQIKPLEKFVEEIEYFQKCTNAKFFYFWDNSFPPAYLEQFAESLIKTKLKISYSLYARFEAEFSYDLLKKLKKSGCQKILWGLDSASEQVLKYINKGIDIDVVPEILKNSHKAGISNTVHLILGHPKQDVSDFNEDIDFVKKNKKYIDLVYVNESLLFYKNSLISKDFSTYKNLIKTTKEQRNYTKNFIYDLYFNKQKMFCICDVGIYNLLYLKKYGCKKLRILKLIYNLIYDNTLLFNLYIKFYVFLLNCNCTNNLVRFGKVKLL